MDIAKAGWLYRQTTVLHRWVRNWFVLYVNGDLKYFDSPDSLRSEDSIAIRVEVINIRTGHQVDATPPEGLKKDYLIALRCRDNAVWRMCADSEDDMRAWEMSIQEARNQVPEGFAVRGDYPYCPPPEYSDGGYYGNGYPGVVLARPGEPYYGGYPYRPGTTVIYQDPDYCRRGRYYRGYDGTDVAVGAMAGMAMGGLLWGPMLWW